MRLLMIVFRSLLKARVHALLEQCEIHTHTEIPETLGNGRLDPEKAPVESCSEHSRHGGRHEAHATPVSDAVEAWHDEAAY